MPSVLAVVRELLIGRSLVAFAAQYVLLVLLSIVFFRQVVKTRVGSMDALLVLSRVRTAASFVVCNLVGLAAYQLLLRLDPASSWRQFFWFLGAAVVSYPVYGLVVTPIGYVLDGGKAIAVTTARHKPNQASWLVDLTKEGGKMAQLIPRGAIAAYLTLLFGGCVVSRL